jgi:alpha-1,2-mannosyltransferase
VLTPVPVAALQVLCLLVNFGLLVGVCVLSCRLAGVQGREAAVAVILFSAIALWSEPVFTTFAYGQINLLLLALVLWDFTRPEQSRLRGIGTGLAAGLKVTPAILIVYLVLTRRYRAAATATATFAATIGLSALIDPSGARAFWTHDLFDLQRVGNVEDSVNQTLRGVLVRLDHTRNTRPTELVLILLVLLAGLVIARAAHQVLGDAWGLPACAVTGLLTSPIAWTHHWIWVVPIAVLLWFRARVWLIPTVAIFSTFAVWIVPHVSRPQLRLTAVELALSALYVLFGLGFLALTARRTWLGWRAAPAR